VDSTVKTVGVLAIALVLLGLSRVVGQAQSDSLPTNLLFTAASRTQDPQKSQMMLMRIDAKTLAITPFYVDQRAAESGLRALKWSPDGRYLAIYRVEHVNASDPTPKGYLWQICILTRAGLLRNCLDDSPSTYTISSILRGQSDEIQPATLSWSADSQRVYFVSVAAGTLRLIEADANTGKRLNVLREYPDTVVGGDQTLISWSIDRSHIAVGIGRQWNVIDPTTSQIVDLYSLVDTQVKYLEFCLQFSPKGSYLVAFTRTTNEKVVVVDMQGTILHTIDAQNGYGNLYVTCPTWQQDEGAFYFVGRAEQDELAHVFRYSLAERKLTVLYHLPKRNDPVTEHSKGALAPYLAIAPDASVIAANGIDNPTSPEIFQVTVIYADGHTRSFGGNYYYAIDPLWVPPQQ
jgi:Tol biopolymer transport system component